MMKKNPSSAIAKKIVLQDILLLDQDLQLGVALSRLCKSHPVRPGKQLNIAQIWSHYHLLQVPQWEFACGLISEREWLAIENLGSSLLTEKLNTFKWILLTDTDRETSLSLSKGATTIARHLGAPVIYERLLEVIRAKETTSTIETQTNLLSENSETRRS